MILSVGHGWTQGMMPLEENPKLEGYVDKEIQANQ